MGRDHMMKTSTPKSNVERRANTIQAIEARIVWCMTLDTRFRNREYSEPAERELLAQNDIVLKELERELKNVRVGR